WTCLYIPTAVVRHHRGSTLGVRSARRLALIERNRVLLAAKLFPWSLLWLNGGYYLARILAGAWWAMRGYGEAGRFPGISGKLTVATALLRGDLAAMKLLPKMFQKRRRLNGLRKLSPRQVRQLLLRYKIPLRTLSRSAT